MTLDPTENTPNALPPNGSPAPTAAAKTARALLNQESDAAPDERGAFLNLFLNSPDPVLLFSPAGEFVAKNNRASTFWNGAGSFLPASLISEVTRVGESGEPLRLAKKEQMIQIPSTRGQRFFLPTVFRLFPEAEMTSPEENIVVCVLEDKTDWARSENIRNNLLSSIHHELNTPLTSARVGLYLLAEQQVGELNEVQAELVDRAKEDLDREIATIQNVLALMRSESIGAVKPTGDPIDLHQLLDEVMLELQDLTQSLHLILNRRFGARAPMICIERETLLLIVKQIFSSVIKHVEKDTTVDVITFAGRESCTLELRSSDSALVDSLPDNLFSLPFESEHMRGVQCVDLGLRVAHEIVHEHGGEVKAAKDADTAVLTLRFPCIDTAEGGKMRGG